MTFDHNKACALKNILHKYIEVASYASNKMEVISVSRLSQNAERKTWIV